MIDSMVAQCGRLKDELKSKDYNPTDSFLGASMQYWTDLDLYNPIKTANTLKQKNVNSSGREGLPGSGK